jgi:colanic acid biosynthesis glycosyl transferase WcaI
VRLPAEELRHGVQIHRVAATGLGRKRMLHRLSDYATFYAAATARCFALPKMDACVALTTPPFVGSIGVAYKQLRGARFVLWVMDLYPDIIAAMGILRRNSLEYRLLHEVSRWIYRSADRVVTLGQEMADRLIADGVPAGKVATVPSWSPGEAVMPSPDCGTPFRDRHGINGHFVVMYSGNMGVVHDFPTILGAADRLRDHENLMFLFVGGGAERRRLVDEVRRRRLRNVRFFPYQPLGTLSESLGAADLHLISMKPNVEGLLVPSKLYGILAAGRPSLLIGPEKNEVARTLTDSQSGWVVPPGHPNRLVDRIETLMTRPELVRTMGQRARDYYEAQCSRTRRATELVGIIEGGRRPPG